MKLQYFVVAFIDILGFSQYSLENWENPHDSPLEKLLAFREIKSASQVVLGDPYTAGKTGNVWTRIMGDSLVLVAEFWPNSRCGDVYLALLTIYINLIYLWKAVIREGFVVRGGVELDFAHLDGKEVIGPALIRAYEIEKCISKTARIVVGPNFLHNLVSMHDIFKGHRYSGFSGYSSGYGDFRKWLYKSSDGMICVRYAPKLDITPVMKLRDACTEARHRQKYSEILYYIENESEIESPSDADIEECIERMKKLLRRDTNVIHPPLSKEVLEKMLEYHRSQLK